MSYKLSNSAIFVLSKAWNDRMPGGVVVFPLAKLVKLLYHLKGTGTLCEWP